MLSLIRLAAPLTILPASTPAYFSWLSPALVDAFLKKCRSMYQREQEGSPTDKLLVYSMMANICSELSGRDEGELAGYNYGLSRSFSNLMLQVLATFPMMTPACLDAAEALMVAVCAVICSELTDASIAKILTCSGINNSRNVQAFIDLVIDRRHGTYVSVSRLSPAFATEI